MKGKGSREDLAVVEMVRVIVVVDSATGKGIVVMVNGRKISDYDDDEWVWNEGSDSEEVQEALDYDKKE